MYVVIEVIKIDEISETNYKLRRKRGLGLSFEKHQHLRLVGGNEEHQD